MAYLLKDLNFKTPKTNIMKYVFSIVFLFIFQITSFSQEDSTSVQKLLTATWEVAFIEKGSSFSKDILNDLKEDQKAKKYRNYNTARYTFKEDGGFHLMSISDYGLSDEKGTYSLIANSTFIKRSVIRPNALKRKKKTKIKTKKSKILYLKDKILVLKTKKKIIYLVRS